MGKRKKYVTANTDNSASHGSKSSDSLNSHTNSVKLGLSSPFYWKAPEVKRPTQGHASCGEAKI